MKFWLLWNYSTILLYNTALYYTNLDMYPIIYTENLPTSYTHFIVASPEN